MRSQPDEQSNNIESTLKRVIHSDMTRNREITVIPWKRKEEEILHFHCSIPGPIGCGPTVPDQDRSNYILKTKKRKKSLPYINGLH